MKFQATSVFQDMQVELKILIKLLKIVVLQIDTTSLKVTPRLGKETKMMIISIIQGTCLVSLQGAGFPTAGKVALKRMSHLKGS